MVPDSQEGAISRLIVHIQDSAKRQSPGLVNLVSAVANHFCLALPTAVTQPGAHLSAELLYTWQHWVGEDGLVLPPLLGVPQPRHQPVVLPAQTL